MSFSPRARIAAALLLASLVSMPAVAEPTATAASAKEVLKIYADIAEAAYGDSLATAKTLKLAIDRLLEQPNQDSLIAARAAWVAARIPYMQTEAYRFGNPIVDDWEGKVNAWPLDEGLIDYVGRVLWHGVDENALYAANVIANATLTVGGKTGRCRRRSRRSSVRRAAGSRRRRGECRDRLSRDRVPALGPGSERHRAGRRQPSGDRFRHRRTAPTAIATAAPPISRPRPIS